MANEPLEVRMNMYEAYKHGEGHIGQVIKQVSPTEHDKYLGGTVHQLLCYMTKDGNYTEQQMPLVNSVRDLLKKPDSLKVRLCNEDDEIIEGEMSHGEISLSDIVKDKVGENSNLVNLAICASPKVGYNG
jgi:hypothetical protein